MEDHSTISEVLLPKNLKKKIKPESDQASRGNSELQGLQPDPV